MILLPQLRPSRVASKHNRGIALIIVMVVITMLTILAGGFAYSMKVETRLAGNSAYEGDLEWIGRSGVEFGRYILGQHLTVPVEGAYDALNQKWAGGPMGTNDVLANISLENNPLGKGSYSIKIEDMERKFNINMVNDQIIQEALRLIGVDARDFATISDSILDWREPGINPRLTGAKDKYYISLNPDSPYVAKKGPIDDMSELLLIKGITPGLYWGGGEAAPQARSSFGAFGPPPGASSGVGLIHLFCAISTGQINPNTASAEVLSIVPGMDPALAQEILRARRGLDGVDGTEDDLPFHSPREIAVPGLPPQAAAIMSRSFTTRSYNFQITVDAKMGLYHRRFIALVRRNSRQDIPVLYFHWK